MGGNCCAIDGQEGDFGGPAANNKPLWAGPRSRQQQNFSDLDLGLEEEKILLTEGNILPTPAKITGSSDSVGSLSSGSDPRDNSNGVLYTENNLLTEGGEERHYNEPELSLNGDVYCVDPKSLLTIGGITEDGAAEDGEGGTNEEDMSKLVTKHIQQMRILEEKNSVLKDEFETAKKDRYATMNSNTR